MFVMQIDGELLPFRFTLGHYRFLKETVLNALWEVTPMRNTAFPSAQMMCSLFQQALGSSPTSYFIECTDNSPKGAFHFAVRCK